MADLDSFLQHSPATNGDGETRLTGEGSSDEEYERMTAAEVLSKLEEVRLNQMWVWFSSTSVCHIDAGLDQ